MQKGQVKKHCKVRFTPKFYTIIAVLLLSIVLVASLVELSILNNKVQELNAHITNIQLEYEEDIYALEVQNDIILEHLQGDEDEDVIVEQEVEDEEAESNEDISTTSQQENTTADTISSQALYSASYLKQMGVINWNNYRWTWYSQRVLAGGGLNIPGRHVDENGYVCDVNDRICLASGFTDKGTIVQTPFGKEGCVYDYCATPNTYDVYTDF